MRKTNNSIFTRALALVLCIIMLAGTLSSCFNGADVNNGPSASNPPSTGNNTGNNAGNGTSKDPVQDPVVDPADPDQIFIGATAISQGALIYGTLANDVTIGEADGVGAVIPANVKIANGTSSLALSVKNTETGSEIELGDGETAKSLDVHIEGVAADNKVPMIVNLGAVLATGLNETELKLYHTEDGTPVLMTRVESASDFAIHNQYTYNAETGEVSIYVASFSVFSAVQTSADVWDGTSDTTWYNENDTEFTLTTAEQFAGFRDLVDGGNTFEGKTVKLGVDIDLDDKLFDPIGFGYYKDDKRTKVEGVVTDTNTVFMGTFDGGNHTVYNLYQNCWELDSDKEKYSTYTYSTAGAGLFASIKNATIKNLAISGAEVVFECVDMGVLVGYAQGECHFENIVITNANIANYNRYTGGLVGEVSYGVDNNGDGYSHTFKNITIDSSVTVSGLWGSFGCGMGGVIGGKWGDATVLMENVISAPVMDVYNDVVSAYQWYAFRGCGMLIGHTEEPYSDGRHSGIATASFLTCENVKVYYGDWVNYTYYQFANQTDAEGNVLWYSNYPWVRAEAGEYCNAFSNIRYGIPLINGVKVTELSEEEFNAAVTGSTKIIFDQLYGADRGMYGQAAHEGVTVINKNTKTIYIYNNLGWENLKLHYWYRNGEDTWTNISADGVSMDSMYLSAFNVYKIDLPAYVDGFKIVADDENDKEFTLADLKDGETYTVGGETHEHVFDANNKCECGAYKIQKGELVTDVNDLKNGEKIIIVAVNSSVALGTTQNTNNRNQVAIVKNDDGTVTINDNVQIITLEAGNIEGTFAFNVGDGYLYAASSSSNHLKTQNDETNDGNWLITIENGVATIKAQGEYTRNWLMYNATSSIFSCYSSGQQEVAIYKLSTEETIEAHDCSEFAFGATCEDNAICSKCSKVIEDSALGHDYVGKETAPTCTDAGYVTYKCSRCDDDYREAGDEALGHNYVDGSCSVCGAIDSSAIDYSGRYYIATIRTSGNYFYMTSDLGTASTKRYQAVDSGLTTLPEEITSGEGSKIFVLEKNEDGTYSIFAEGVDGDNYLGWTSGNSGALVSKENAKAFTVELSKEGTYTISFDNRFLSLNGTSGNDYFAFYEGTQKQDLSLIPVYTCEHNYESSVTAPKCIEDGYTTYTCTKCNYSYTDDTVAATGHQNTTTTTVDATCTTEGSTTVTCDDCGATVSTETIPTIPHTDVNTDNDHNCDVCDAENVTKHNYVDGTCDCGETEPTEPAHECESVCGTCGGCTDATCGEDACENKCNGHTTTTTVSKSHTEIAQLAGVSTSSNGGSLNGKEIGLDDAIAVIFDKASSTSNPVYYSESIRVYQGGATLTIKSEEGYTIKTIKITVANNSAGKGPIGVEGGSASELTDLVYTITANEGVSQVVITTTGTTSSTRLYVANIEVEYIEAGSGSEGGTTEPTHTCESVCGECGKCTDAECGEDACTEKCQCSANEPAEPTVVLEITVDDFNGTSYAANNNTKTENGHSYTSYQVMKQSSNMQWQKSKGYITIASNVFVKLELKATAGTYSVTVGGKTVTGTTANGVTTYDLSGLTGEIKISVGSVLGTVEYLKFYK